MAPKKYCHGKSSFQEKWLTDPELGPWILKAPNDVHSARCRYCKATLISLSSMGRQALTSHMKGQKHMKAVSATSSPSVASFLNRKPETEHAAIPPHPIETPQTSTAVLSQPGPSSSGVPSVGISPCVPVTNPVESLVPLGERGLKKYLLNDSVTKAEIIWAIHSVMTHTSFKSAAEGVETMKLMFSDSRIVDKLELHRTKVSYLLMFGIAPYFKDNLVRMIKECPTFVVLFDESYNKVSSKQQMDICVRFWNSEREETCTRYLTSEFLHSGKAVDLQLALLKSIECLNINNLLQVSMDGPNVNIRLLKDLKVFLNEQGSDRKIVDFGSCGLHTAHNAFKSAMTATGWPIVTFLRACYNYFKNSPARRGDFIRITKSDKFPKKFCAVRWIENVDVSQTAIDILPNLKLYIETIAKKPEEKSPSFKFISDCLKDPLIGAKLAFFKTLASDAEPFLREFQTDWPYIPFLHSALLSTLLTVMKRFVKPEKIKVGVDVDQEENLLLIKKIDLGFLTKLEISKSKAKDIAIAVLHKEAYHGLKAFVKKLETRSPLKYQITRYLSSLDPKVAIEHEGEELFDKLVEDFVKLNWFSGTKGDRISRQFKVLIKTVTFQTSAKEFRRNQTRVDHFWIKELKKEDPDRYLDLKGFLEQALILSHGNAHVERGFSVNRECLVENLKEPSLIGLRTVYDAVIDEGGLQNVHITKSMIITARNASCKYKDYLREARLIKSGHSKTQDDLKKKRKLLQDLKCKKARVMEDAHKESDAIDRQIEDLTKQL